MKRMKIAVKRVVFALFVSIAMLLSFNVSAQCSVCASNVANSSKSATEKAGLGLNKGIIMLLSMPYAVAGVIGILWYKNSRKKRITNQA